jgi:hypothetical protein
MGFQHDSKITHDSWLPCFISKASDDISIIGNCNTAHNEEPG